MRIALYGDSLTKGIPGVAYLDYLRQRSPGLEILNYGYGGDTVVSLYERIVRRKLTPSVDLSFLFVGVNDILVHVSPTFPVIKNLLRQPWVDDVKAFSDYYERILDVLAPKTRRVFSISPLLIGEDVNSEWNMRLATLADAIRNESVRYGNVEYVDLRSAFIAALDHRQISSYVLTSATRVVLDTWFLRRSKQVDRMAAARGLQLTLDGVHLNSKGAQIVAEEFFEVIARYDAVFPS